LSQNFYHITDDLLVKYMLGETTGEERAWVEEWLAADAVNKKQFEDFKTIWEESKKLAAVSTVDEDAAWARFKNRVKNPLQKEAVVRKMNLGGWLKIAALFILVAFRIGHMRGYKEGARQILNEWKQYMNMEDGNNG